MEVVQSKNSHSNFREKQNFPTYVSFYPNIIFENFFQIYNMNMLKIDHLISKFNFKDQNFFGNLPNLF